MACLRARRRGGLARWSFEPRTLEIELELGVNIAICWMARNLLWQRYKSYHHLRQGRLLSASSPDLVTDLAHCWSRLAFDRYWR